MNRRDVLAALKEYQAGVDRLFDTVDVIVTPTVPVRRGEDDKLLQIARALGTLP